MQVYIKEILECPKCHGELEWHIFESSNDRITKADIICKSCSANYMVDQGIGVFLTSNLDRNDLWKKTSSHLVNYLNSNPEIKRDLLETPINLLEPADQFFRALYLEEQGLIIEAKKIEAIANHNIYSDHYKQCWESQTNFIIEELSGITSPIVDIACGRGYLAEHMARELDCPLIMSDFSVSVLFRNQQWLKSIGMYDKISLLALDARKTPFKNKSIKIMTTNLGLANIENPGKLLEELFRVVSGKFLSINHFYEDSDEANLKVIREAGLEKLLYRQSALENFSDAGWNTSIKNSCKGIATPTPKGKIIDGAGIDGIPVKETVLEWCVLEATN